MSTNVISQKDIKRDWHLFDAKGKVLGRLASEIAQILMGKNKAQFVRYLDSGDYVVVTNAKGIVVTGKKAQQKKYVRHSGYPGGYREETFNDKLAKRPEDIIKHAVVGMLPKNRLGKVMVKKLHIFAGEEHNFAKQLEGKNEHQN